MVGGARTPAPPRADLVTTEPAHHPIQARGFLFADLRGYTAFAEARGDAAAAELLRTYRAIVRRVIAQFHGAEIRTEGDSFYVVFPSATDAVRAGLAILEEARAGTEGAPLRIGIGVHAGETTETEEGYVGGAVNIAARVCAIAGAGELFVTDTVRALARGQLTVQFVPRGRRRLKGIAEPIAVYAVVSEAASPVRRWSPAAVRGSVGRRLNRLALPAVLAVGVLVLTASAIALIGRDLGGTAREEPASAPAAATASASPDGTDLSPTPEPDAGAQREAANERLRSRIDPDAARHCAAADPDDAPLAQEVRGILPIPTIAGLRCELGGGSAPDLVEYWQASLETVQGRGGGAQDAFFYLSGLRNIPPGDCSTETRASGAWEFGSTSGNILCSRFGGEALLMWTYEGTAILAQATREDGDNERLYRWWEEHARLLRPEPSS
jgi:class 3 adenylate cyclase